MTAFAGLIDAGTRHQTIVDNGEDALAANPVALFVLDLAIIEHGSLVEPDAAAVDGLGKGDFIRVEVFPARFSHNFMGCIP